MHLSGIDLNLLVTLNALISEAHVGKAASRIGLSQPAASHALQRLRELIGDPLLVRVGGRMQLTPRAESLRAPLALVLEQTRSLFVTDDFDPTISTRRFTIMMSDHVVDLVMPPLLQRLGKQAPKVRLDVAAWRASTDVTSEFARSVDLVIACTTGPLAGFHREHLFSDTEAMAVRRSNPAAPHLKKMDVFLKIAQVAIVGQGQSEDPIDTWLRERRIERRIGIVVPSYLQALHIVARTNFAAFVPRRLIEALGGPLSLVAISPPVDPGTYEEFMFHPVRAHVDAGSLWLRNHVRQIGRKLDRRPSVRA